MTNILLNRTSQLSLLLLFISHLSFSQTKKVNTYWNSSLQINSYRLPPAASDQTIEYIDLDGDGDPDILRYNTIKDMPVQWIDDDDDMKEGDLEGDTDNDCLMIDCNKDGKYGSDTDLILDWNDNDGDGKADMQVAAHLDWSEDTKAEGHYMWVLDTDKDNIFNYIDWNRMELRAWIHDGQSDFLKDYHGHSVFMKIHSRPKCINDLRLNWENPFLFYDPDKDGLSEVAIRFTDDIVDERENGGVKTTFDGNIEGVYIGFDLDRDNAPGNEFDFDMSLRFRGKEGFNYMDQVHKFENMRGLPAADKYFEDARWRQLSELIYPDHDAAWDLIFKRGKWDNVWFVYDEDDDCNRWERVDFYEPLNMFKTGSRNGGLDNNPQADTAGDRGEWDLDNSGDGQLYVSQFDGRIHLYGAEWGAWRIDQNAKSYQGMGGLYDGYGPGRLQKEPDSFATVKYSDTDENGFIDLIEYDLDGDTIFEQSVSLLELGINDSCEVINTASMSYDDFESLQNRVADNMWQQAEQALKIAQKEKLNTSWYALLMQPKSTRQKYHHGYWLQFYLYNDLIDLYKRKSDNAKIKEITKAYYSGNW